MLLIGREADYKAMEFSLSWDIINGDSQNPKVCQGKHGTHDPHRFYSFNPNKRDSELWLTVALMKTEWFKNIVPGIWFSTTY